LFSPFVFTPLIASPLRFRFAMLPPLLPFSLYYFRFTLIFSLLLALFLAIIFVGCYGWQLTLLSGFAATPLPARYAAFASRQLSA